VFDTKQEMWAWQAKDSERAGVCGGPSDRFGAMCITYEIVKFDKGGNEKRKSDIGTLLFARQQLGAGTIAHEIGHAAFHYDRLINGNALAEYGENNGESEERVLYLLAEMVSDCVNKMYELKVLQ